MQINKVDNHSMAFQSKFVPNTLLKDALTKASKDNDRQFLNAIKTILNDGKDDVIELEKRTSRIMNLNVNGEPESEGHIFLNYYSNVGIDLIEKYASKLPNFIKLTSKYANFSAKEKSLVKEDICMIKLLSESFEKSRNYIEDMQNRLEKVKQIIDKNTENELNEIRKAIFKA